MKRLSTKVPCTADDDLDKRLLDRWDDIFKRRDTSRDKQ